MARIYYLEDLDSGEILAKGGPVKTEGAAMRRWPRGILLAVAAADQAFRIGQVPTTYYLHRIIQSYNKDARAFVPVARIWY